MRADQKDGETLKLWRVAVIVNTTEILFRIFMLTAPPDSLCRGVT